MNTNILKLISEQNRKRLIELIYKAGAGHTGGDLSCLNLLTVLYHEIMNINKDNLNNPQRDRFIMSKGHCVESLFVTLESKSIIVAAVRGDIKKLENSTHPSDIMGDNTYTVEQIEAAKSVYFVLDCGDDDFLINQNFACYQSMKQEKMNVQFRCYDGAHASYYWYDAFRRALVYFTRHFSEQCK